MLCSLFIKNIAVFDEAVVDFGPGLQVLTGETGAGKSILIDAVGLLLGGKASRSILRAGAKSAQVAAVFSGVGEEVRRLIAEYGADAEDGEVSVSREMFADGRNVCRINGRPVTVSALRECGERLINIHGQSDSLALYRRESHIGYLDRFCGLERELEEYRACRARYRDADARLHALEERSERRMARIEELSAVSEELFAADLQEGEEEHLQELRRAGQNQERIVSALSGVYALLYGGEEGGALDCLQQARQALSAVSSYDRALALLEEQVGELCALTEDAASEARRVLEGFDFSAEELEAAQARLDLIARLKRKYGMEMPELIAYREEAGRELLELQDFDRSLEQARVQRDAVLQELTALASALSSRRGEMAAQLEEQVARELQDLDMPGVSFRVQMESDRSADGLNFHETGTDIVEFLISPNPGEGLKSISKIASGGEMARIMLAIKSVLSGAEPVGTLIFDEIDTGVSGRAAQKIAQKMLALSRCRQVMAVTHLPQIAAMADDHFYISKQVLEDRTAAQIKALSGEARAEEIARITGGLTITDTTLQSAREMLAQAAAYGGRLPGADANGKRGEE